MSKQEEEEELKQELLIDTKKIKEEEIQKQYQKLKNAQLKRQQQIQIKQWQRQEPVQQKIEN